MRFIRPLSLALVVLPVLSFPIFAKADSLVFDLSQSQTPLAFSAGKGVGQAVVASQTMTIDSFGFDLKATAGSTVDYFIIDVTNPSIVLGPTAVTGVPTSQKQFTYLTGLSTQLVAGDEYYFGFYGSGMTTVNTNPTLFDNGNGLSIPTSGATSADFTGDVLSQALSGTLNTSGFSNQDLSLRIYSNNPPAATPEPSSLVLMGTGILAAAGAMRRRFLQ